ncbi:hypothetical protein QCA50_007059 [Cerrena zonata]|uniref:DUF6534 domain-containing protein n=1 Tax=Cerrena zonata TaxID=2478898 RepID=A0AAW0FBH4_9APHY
MASKVQAGVESLAGGLIECFAISCIFYGITIAQANVYFRTCGRDPQWMKWMATTVIFLETVHTAVLLRKLYFYSVLAIKNPLNLTHVDWTIPAVLILQNVIEIIVNSFYIHRMWLYSKSIMLTIGMFFILLSRDATFLFTAIKSATFTTFGDFDKPGIKGPLIVTHSLAIGLDALLAASMVYHLYRDRTRFRSTRGVISWMMTYYVNTGVVLAALTLAILVAYLAAPKSLLYAGFIDIYGKAMANSLFGALNSRQVIRNKISPVTIISTNAYAESNNGSTGYGINMNAVQVEVEVSTETTKVMDPL